MIKLTLYDFNHTGTLAVHASDDGGATIAVVLRNDKAQGYHYGAIKDASGMPDFIDHLRFLESESRHDDVQAGLLAIVDSGAHTK